MIRRNHLAAILSFGAVALTTTPALAASVDAMHVQAQSSSNEIDRTTLNVVVTDDEQQTDVGIDTVTGDLNSVIIRTDASSSDGERQSGVVLDSLLGDPDRSVVSLDLSSSDEASRSRAGSGTVSDRFDIGHILSSERDRSDGVLTIDLEDLL